jgi:hypothetical protein
MRHIESSYKAWSDDEMNTQKNPEKIVFGFESMAIVAILLFCAITASGQAAPKGNVSAADSATNMPFMLLQIQSDVQGNLMIWIQM